MMTITEECINCSACIDECESDAIYNASEEFVIEGESHSPMSDEVSFIVPELCDDCKSCIEVCAVDAIEEK